MARTVRGVSESDHGRISETDRRHSSRAAGARVAARAAAAPPADGPFRESERPSRRPVVLDDQALVEKVVDRRRGGFCYELNGAFAALLAVAGLPGDAAVRPGRRRRRFARPALRPRRLRVDRRTGPVARRRRLRQVQPPSAPPRPPHRPTRSRRHLPRRRGQPRRSRRAEGRRARYRLEQRPRVLADFEPTCWWHQTSPASHFTQSLVCSLLTERGRVTLNDRRSSRPWATTAASGIWTATPRRSPPTATTSASS